MAECGGAQARPVQASAVPHSCDHRHHLQGTTTVVQPLYQASPAQHPAMVEVDTGPGGLHVSMFPCFHAACLHSSSAGGQQLAGAGPGSLHTASVGFGVATLWITRTDVMVKGA